MLTTINQNHAPHTGLLRAGMMLIVTGPTPKEATTTVNLTRSAVTVLTAYAESGQTQRLGPYTHDLQYSVSSTGYGSTVTQQEAVRSTGSPLGASL